MKLYYKITNKLYIMWAFNEPQFSEIFNLELSNSFLYNIEYKKTHNPYIVSTDDGRLLLSN